MGNDSENTDQYQETDDLKSPRSDESPPSYNSVADPPPTYDSMFGELKQARDESSGTLDLLKKVSIIFLSTIGCTVCLAIFLAIPISSIYIGARYKNECPIERFIPIYLIVLGAFGVLRNIVGLYTQIKSRNDDGEDEDKKKSALEKTIDCFLMAWFIAGNVWIYRIYNKVNMNNHLSDYYCNKTLYLFAFWLTTASYMLVGILCCCMCFVACCSLMTSN